MNVSNVIILVVLIWLAVFAGAFFDGFSRVFETRIDFLPAIMVYTGMTASGPVVILAAVFGGLAFDALSANPLGVSILPLYMTGFLIYMNRDLLLRDQVFAQFVLGLMAGAAVPALGLIFLIGLGEKPLLGWGSLWQWAVMALGGAIVTPWLFWLLDRLNRALSYPDVREPAAFRSDREIKRGRL